MSILFKDKLNSQSHKWDSTSIPIKDRFQPLNRQIGFNVNSIQRQIQQLNPQI